MKKKLMMVAVLFGALTLGACVDDNESASVTAVREAKAEQLKAVAALANAQAEAEIIKANAEAALKAAEAEYQKALAAVESAKADSIAAYTAYAQEKYQLELAKIQAEYEKLIAEYKADAAEYQKELWDNTDAYVKEVYACYLGAMNKVNSLNESIIEKKVAIAKAAIDKEAAQAAIEGSLYSLNQAIAQRTQRIAYYESLETVDATELQKQMDEMAANAWDLMKNQKPAAEEAKEAAEEAMNEARNAINPLLYAYTSNPDAKEKAAWEEALLPYLKAWLYLHDMGSVQSAAGFIHITKRGLVECEEVEGAKQTKYTLNESKADQTEWIAAQRAGLEEAVATEEAKLGKPSEGEGETAVAATGLYVNLETAQANLKAAQDQLKAEKAKEAAAQDKNLIAELEKKTAANGELTIAVMRAEEAIAKQEEVIAKAEEAVKEFEDALATVQDAKEVAAYEEAWVAMCKKVVEWQEATEALTAINEAIDEIGITKFDGTTPNSWYSDKAYGELASLKNGTVDVEELILTLKAQIAEYEASIAKIEQFGATAYIHTYEGYIYNPYLGGSQLTTITETQYQFNDMSHEDMIALLEADLADLEAELEIEKALMAKYKAALDAALAAE